MPVTMLIEARKSLCLLFPPENDEVCEWYRRKASKLDIDTGILKYGSLTPQERTLDTFYHFRDRLIILKQHYDRSQPGSMTQLLHDRRDFIEFLTVANALIMAFFTLVTVVFGLVQIGIASAALDVAKAQLKHDKQSDG